MEARRSAFTKPFRALVLFAHYNAVVQVYTGSSICMASGKQAVATVAGAILTSICCLGGLGARLGGGGEALAFAWYVCAGLRCCLVWACWYDQAGALLETGSDRGVCKQPTTRMCPDRCFTPEACIFTLQRRRARAWSARGLQISAATLLT